LAVARQQGQNSLQIGQFQPFVPGKAGIVIAALRCDEETEFTFFRCILKCNLAGKKCYRNIEDMPSGPAFFLE